SDHGRPFIKSATCDSVRPVTRTPHGNSRHSVPLALEVTRCTSLLTIEAFLKLGLATFRCLAARGANLSAQRCIDDSESPNASLTRRWLQPRVPSKAVTSRFSPSENRGRVFPLVSRSCCTRRLSASICVSSIHAVSRQNGRHARRGSATGYSSHSLQSMYAVRSRLQREGPTKNPSSSHVNSEGSPLAKQVYKARSKRSQLAVSSSTQRSWHVASRHGRSAL